VLKYVPGYIGDWGEKVMGVRKNQISAHFINKGTLTASLVIETTGGWNFVFENLNKKVIPYIQTALNKLHNERPKTRDTFEPQVSPQYSPSTERTVTDMGEPFFCQVCESARPATTPRMKCETCNRYVCLDCFSQMASAGKTNCPMCGGKLYSQ
ncbi:MAG: hypothetical protein ACTSW1_12195, partial [Candidatus Hodarchaeales archaeon]